MVPGIKVSISSLMVFVIIVALQLVLFQDVWQILVIPPITIIVIALNLGLLFVLVRPPALETRIVGMLLSSIPVFVIEMMILFRLHARTGGAFGPRIGGRLGALIDEALRKWLETLPDSQTLMATIVQWIAAHLVWIEFALMDILGVALIWAGGWLESRLRRRWVRARALPTTGLPPLDDRAATPL